MLEAGGAEVLGTTSRLNDTNSATHAFISKSEIYLYLYNGVTSVCIFIGC